MKKIAILFLCLFIILSAFAGCTDNGSDNYVEPESGQSVVDGGDGSSATDGDNDSDGKDGSSGSSVTDGTSGSGRTPAQPITDGGTAVPH